MKIQLKFDLPVEKRHRMVKGRVLDVTELVSDARCYSVKWWVAGDKGERIGILKEEAEEMPELFIIPDPPDITPQYLPNQSVDSINPPEGEITILWEDLKE